MKIKKVFGKITLIFRNIILVNKMIVSLTVFLFIFSHFILLKFGTYSYIFVLALLNFMLMHKYIYIIKTLPKIFFVPIILLLGIILLSLLVHINEFFSGTVFFALFSPLLLLITYWIFKQEPILVNNVALFVLILYYIFIFVSGLTTGFSPQDINNYFDNYSRNAVSGMAIILQIFYTATYFRLNKSVPLITPNITFLISVLSYGRSGIGLAFIIVLLSYFIKFLQVKKIMKLIYLALLVLFLIFIILNINIISDFILSKTNFISGFESARSLINNAYLSRLDLETFFTGMDLSKISIIEFYDNNPHNSYINGHAHFGILYLLFILFFLAGSTYLFLIYKNTFLYYILILVYLVRYSLDTSALFGPSDYILFYLFFCLYEPHLKYLEKT